MADINWQLLATLADRRHPNLSRPVVPHAEPGVYTLVSGAIAAHHLLDMAEIPAGSGDERAIEARVFLAVKLIRGIQDRLGRIASWHSRETGPAGMFGSYCVTCGDAWPCDTRRMADGTYTDPGDTDGGG